MQAVFAGGASECGVSLGCSLLEAQNVPDPPFDSTVIGGGGFNLGVKAGDVLFFSFQFLAEDGGAPPDHGRVIATVRPY
jgi:hypothetical protein